MGNSQSRSRPLHCWKCYDELILVQSLRQGVYPGYYHYIFPTQLKKGKGKKRTVSGFESPILVGLIGETGAGKSFLLSKICEVDLPSGKNVNTRGISMKKTTVQNKSVWVMDIEGFGAAQSRRDGHSMEDVLLEKLRDEDFIFKIVLAMSNTFLVIVNDLTIHKQVEVEKVARKINQDSTKGNKLIVVHNYRDVEELSVINIQAENLKRVFRGTKVWMGEKKDVLVVDEIRPVQKGRKIGVRHVFLGKEKSAAGNNNEAVYCFLRNHIADVICNGDQRTLKQRFVAAVQEVLGQMIYGDFNIESFKPQPRCLEKHKVSIDGSHDASVEDCKLTKAGDFGPKEEGFSSWSHQELEEWGKFMGPYQDSVIKIVWTDDPSLALDKRFKYKMSFSGAIIFDQFVLWKDAWADEVNLVDKDFFYHILVDAPGLVSFKKRRIEDHQLIGSEKDDEHDKASDIKEIVDSEGEDDLDEEQDDKTGSEKKKKKREKDKKKEKKDVGARTEEEEEDESSNSLNAAKMKGTSMTNNGRYGINWPKYQKLDKLYCVYECDNSEKHQTLYLYFSRITQVDGKRVRADVKERQSGVTRHEITIPATVSLEEEKLDFEYLVNDKENKDKEENKDKVENVNSANFDGILHIKIPLKPQTIRKRKMEKRRGILSRKNSKIMTTVGGK